MAYTCESSERRSQDSSRTKRSRWSICASWTFPACGSTSPSRHVLSTGQLRGRPRLRRLVHPRLAGDQRERHAGHARADTAFLDPFTADTDAGDDLQHQGPVTGRVYSRDPRNVARKAVNYMKTTGIADTAYFGPEPSSSSSTTCASTRARTRATTDIDADGGELERGQRARGPTSATSCATRKATSRAAADALQDIAHRDDAA